MSVQTAPGRDSFLSRVFIGPGAISAPLPPARDSICPPNWVVACRGVLRRRSFAWPTALGGIGRHLLIFSVEFETQAHVDATANYGTTCPVVGGSVRLDTPKEY